MPHAYDERYKGEPHSTRRATDYELARAMFARRQKLATAYHIAAGDGDQPRDERAAEIALARLNSFDAIFTPPPARPEPPADRPWRTPIQPT